VPASPAAWLLVLPARAAGAQLDHGAGGAAVRAAPGEDPVLALRAPGADRGVLPGGGARRQKHGGARRRGEMQWPIDEEVRRVVEEAHAEVTRLLSEHRDKLESLTRTARDRDARRRRGVCRRRRRAARPRAGARARSARCPKSRPGEAGAVNASAGAVNAGAGAVNASAGAVNAGAGAVNASAGAVNASAGAVNAGAGAVNAGAGAVNVPLERPGGARGTNTACEAVNVPLDPARSTRGTFSTAASLAFGFSAEDGTERGPPPASPAAAAAGSRSARRTVLRGRAPAPGQALGGGVLRRS
jgi:hypothetical protein